MCQKTLWRIVRLSSSNLVRSAKGEYPDSKIVVSGYRPHCRSFLFSTRYRPPKNDLSLLNDFDLFLKRCEPME